MVTRQLRITGLVQGVGYRYALRSEAQKLGLAGWVRNRADGSVEAVVQGPREAVDAVVAWARRGPPAARVAELRETAPEPAHDLRYRVFELRPSV